MKLPRPAPGRARIWILATVCLLLLTAGAVWWGVAATVGKPAWKDVTFRVRDDRTVDVVYLLSKPAGMSVRCLVEAQGMDHSGIGSVEVVVGPLDRDETTQTTTVRTTQRAVRGYVRTCKELTAG